MNVSISPISSGGSSFKDSIVLINQNRLVVRRTYTSLALGVALFAFIFAVCLYGAISGLVVAVMTEHLFVGLGLTLGSVAVIYLLFCGLNFDDTRVFTANKSDGIFTLHRMFSPQIVFKSGSITEVAAVQVIGKLVQAHNGSRLIEYMSYEINLRLSSEERINIIDHGAKKAIDEDAELIAGFFGCKLVHSSSVPRN